MGGVHGRITGNSFLEAGSCWPTLSRDLSARPHAPGARLTGDKHRAGIPGGQTRSRYWDTAVVHLLRLQSSAAARPAASAAPVRGRGRSPPSAARLPRSRYDPATHLLLPSPQPLAPLAASLQLPDDVLALTQNLALLGAPLRRRLPPDAGYLPGAHAWSRRPAAARWSGSGRVVPYLSPAVPLLLLLQDLGARRRFPLGAAQAAARRHRPGTAAPPPPPGSAPPLPPSGQSARALLPAPPPARQRPLVPGGPPRTRRRRLLKRFIVAYKGGGHCTE